MALKLCKSLLNQEILSFIKFGPRLQYVCGTATAVEAASVSSKTRKPKKPSPPLTLRYIYPEFLPDPDPTRRNATREKLERMDMMNRRSNIDIPEFYVGSILAVKISDPHAQGKTNRFVGICIERSFAGLRSKFTLRNVVDHQGMEIQYNLYDPTIQNIQVLRLEKRVDEELVYLRDALPEYSTFSFDMEQEILPEGAEVPVNPLKVKMKPFPWDIKWQIKEVKGIENIDKLRRRKDIKWVRKYWRPWEKYDLMKEYRATIPQEEQSEIWADVYSKLHELEITRRKMARKRSFVVPKKIG